MSVFLIIPESIHFYCFYSKILKPRFIYYVSNLQLIDVILSLLIFIVVTITNEIKPYSSKCDSVTFHASGETHLSLKEVHSHNET